MRTLPSVHTISSVCYGCWGTDDLDHEAERLGERQAATMVKCSTALPACPLDLVLGGLLVFPLDIDIAQNPL